MKKIKYKMKELERQQYFHHYKSMGIVFRRSREANYAVLGQIWPKLELVRDITVVLQTSKNEEDPIKNKGARVLTRLYGVFFFRRSRAANSEVSSGILPIFELSQAFIIVHVTCKNEENPINNEGVRVLTRFSPIISLWKFFSRSRAVNSAVLGRI